MSVIFAGEGLSARLAALLLPLLLPACAPSSEAAGQRLDEEQLCHHVLADGVGRMRYCRSRSIYVDAPQVERAIIVVHGSGLVDRNDYMRQADADELRRRAITRDIFWTVGELDTEANGGCRANAQGEHRRARWANHRQHIAELCADLVAAGDLDVPVDCQAHDARHVEIAGCGRGHACSWDTAVGQAILFAP